MAQAQTVAAPSTPSLSVVTAPETMAHALAAITDRANHAEVEEKSLIVRFLDTTSGKTEAEAQSAMDTERDKHPKGSTQRQLVTRTRQVYQASLHGLIVADFVVNALIKQAVAINQSLLLMPNGEPASTPAQKMATATAKSVQDIVKASGITKEAAAIMVQAKSDNDKAALAKIVAQADMIIDELVGKGFDRTTVHHIAQLIMEKTKPVKLTTTSSAVITPVVE